MSRDFKVGDVAKLHGIGGQLEGKMCEVTEVFRNGTYHVKGGIIDVDSRGVTRTSVFSIAVSGSNLEYDESATALLLARSESGRKKTLGQRAISGKFKMTTDSHTFPGGLPYRLVKDRLGYGDDYRQRVLIPSIESWWKAHKYATTEEFVSEVRRLHDCCYWESGDFLQIPRIDDEDRAFVFKWKILGHTVLLELHDVIFG